MKLFENVFNLHEKAIQLREQHLEVISRNIANVDTPNYKARGIDFEEALAKALNNDQEEKQASDVYTTHRGHLGGQPNRATADLLYTVPFNTSVDGNTVEMSVEQARYGKAAAKYQATLRFLESDIGGIRKALRGE